MAKKTPKIKWLSKPADDDYLAAVSYLSLLVPEGEATQLAKRLKKVPGASFKAKDLFRASGLPLLDGSNFHVDRDRQKIAQGKPLSPLLLVRDTAHQRAIVADGYHRLCAVYSYDEDALIPCRIV